MDDRRSKVPLEYGVMLAAGFVISFANAISHGTYLGIALGLLLVAFGLVAWRFFTVLRGGDGGALDLRVGVLAGVLLVGLVSMPVVALCDPKTLAHAVGSWRLGRIAEVISIAALLSYLPFLGARPESERMKNARFAVFAALTLVAGVAALHASPAPDIDVYTIQQRGSEQFLAGQNPYVTLSVKDTDPENEMMIPYVYPPTSVLTGALGVGIFGDVRYPMLFAILVAGVSVRFIARRAKRALPSLFEDAPALYMWLTPVLFLVVERAWLDPIQVGLVCAAAAAYVGKRPWLTALLFGLAITSKQSMFWLIPLVGFALAFSMRQWIVMGIAAAAPVVPFAIANFARLKYGNFDFMSALRPRSDALVFGSWVARAFHAVFPGSVGFLLAALAVGLASWKLRGLKGFALATLVTYFGFFLFNRWAFANYYYLIMSLAALTAAASLGVTGSQESTAR